MHVEFPVATIRYTRIGVKNNYFLGAIDFNVMGERDGRTRQIRCWKLDMTNGHIREYPKYQAPNSFDNDPNYPPTLSITAGDEQMTEIITARIDLNVAELIGKCQLKWGDDSAKRELSSMLTQLNKIPQTFVQ